MDGSHSCLLGTVPTQDYTACHTHANQAFVYSSALRISALPGTLCPYITCGDLNDYDLYRLIYIACLVPTGGLLRRMRRYGTVGGGVALGVGFEASKAHTRLRLMIEHSVSAASL